MYRELIRIRHRAPTWTTASALAVGASLAVPALWSVLTTHAVTMGDVALIELRTRDVLSSHPPLLGAYSRYGWAHPGSILFWVLAVPYRLFGSNGDSLRLAALVVNAVMLGALLWVVRGRGRAVRVATVAAIVFLVWGEAPNVLTDSWNATIDVVPFMLTVVACWCALCGDRAALLVAVVAASFTFQTHAGFGIVLLPLVASTLAVLAVRARRAAAAVPPRQVAIAVLAGLMTALPVLVDILIHWPGNLQRLIRWSVHNDQPKVGLGDSLRFIGRTSSLSFPWHARFPNQFVFTYATVSSGVLPGALLVLLIAAWVTATRRRMLAEAQFCACLAVTWLGGLTACASIARPLGYWMIEWLQPLAWLTWGCVVVVAWRVIRSRWPRALIPTAPRILVSLALAAAFAVGTVASARATITDRRDEANNVAIETLTAGAAGLGNGQALRIDFDPTGFASSAMMFAVADQLDARGFAVCVDPGLALYAGSSRVCAGRPDLHLLVRDESAAVAPVQDATTLAVFDQLSVTDRATIDALTSTLAAVCERNGLAGDVDLLYTPFADLVLRGTPPAEVVAHRADFERLSRLRRTPGRRFGIYAIPDQPGASPTS